MKRISIHELSQTPAQHFGKELTVCGWARTIRESKNLGFIELNDGSQLKNLQVVVDAATIENFPDIMKENVGASFVVNGVCIETPNGQQPFELKATKIQVEGSSSSEYPLQKKQHSLEFLRSIPHLRARSNTLGSVFRVRSVAAFAIHKFFNERGFVYTHTPIITGNDCEGAGEMFRVTALDLDNPPKNNQGDVDYAKDFFGRAAHLTVSGQLEGECMAMAFGKIYTFGPTFRAENSNTARHAAEFWMIEPEISFADLSDNMQLAESMLKYVIGYVLEHCAQELEFFNDKIDKGLIDRLSHVQKSKVAVVSYTEAIDLLQKSTQTFEFPATWGCDLQTEHERYLTEQLFKQPVFVINYPAGIKAFYMRMNNDNKTVAAMDLLVPGIGEIIGGSQREERVEILKQRIQECGLREQDYDWYFELRRFGGTKHAGFGLGFERLVMYLTGITNIRDVLLFPRTPGTFL
ncbi:MAG: asparagine--tRNA ligase [Oscillospiraceae bacterium]|jgi:asparaginyl-tRNA synthetase|nr:asparagine--tRNA ligase [Oscillospiraceae bacterium]